MVSRWVFVVSGVVGEKLCLMYSVLLWLVIVIGNMVLLFVLKWLNFG